MPCTKYVEDELDIEVLEYDEDGNPCVLPDEFNLLTRQPVVDWLDLVYDEIVDLWQYIKYLRDEKGVPILEKINFQKFLIFVQTNSVQARDGDHG